MTGSMPRFQNFHNKIIEEFWLIFLDKVILNDDSSLRQKYIILSQDNAGNFGEQ